MDKSLRLTPLAEAMEEIRSEQVVVDGEPVDRGLLDWNFFGVPFLRAALQVAGAGLSVLLLGSALAGLTPALQIAAMVGLVVLGSYVGYLVWKTIGIPLSDFVNTIFPFSL